MEPLCFCPTHTGPPIMFGPCTALWPGCSFQGDTVDETSFWPDHPHSSTHVLVRRCPGWDALRNQEEGLTESEVFHLQKQLFSALNLVQNVFEVQSSSGSISSFAHHGFYCVYERYGGPEGTQFWVSKPRENKLKWKFWVMLRIFYCSLRSFKEFLFSCWWPCYFYSYKWITSFIYESRFKKYEEIVIFTI